MPNKILIVDDEIMITELLAEHLQDCGYLTFVAQNAEEAISKLHNIPDLIILDINMPGMDGLELCQNIRNHLSCPILFLSARITESDKILGLSIGADDYITKPFSLQELTARISAHLRREERRKSSSRIISSKGLIVNIDERAVSYNDQEIVFSKREFDILEFLMMHPHRVFEKEEIYEAIWGLEAEGDNTVIKEHIRKIRMKLKSATGKEYIETIWGIGYKWES